MGIELCFFYLTSFSRRSCSLDRDLDRLDLPPPRNLNPLKWKKAGVTSDLLCKWYGYLNGIWIIVLMSNMNYLPYRSLLNSLEIGFKCMKLQNPALTHSPISYWRQHAWNLNLCSMALLQYPTTFSIEELFHCT